MSEALPISMRRFERFSMPAAEQRISKAFGLVWDEQMQDWDLINANVELLPSLLPFLRQPDLSDDERFSAMALAVASIDESFMTHGFSRDIWQPFEALLLDAPELHASTIWYWASPSLKSEEAFPVSAFMAQLWRAVEPRLMSSPSQPTAFGRG